MEERQTSFLQGAFILTAAGIIVKIIGAIYRIPLTRLIGAEGMGLYQMAYPIYNIMFVISTGGIPLAISKLVAEKIAVGEGRGAQRVLRLSLALLTVTGLIFSVVLLFSSGFIANNMLGDPRSYYSLLAVAPAVFFVAVMSAFRGFFQGMQTMVPTALSQIAEQTARVTTILLLAYLLVPRGIEYAAAGATFGAATGSIVSLLVLIGIYMRRRGRLNQFFTSIDTTSRVEPGKRILSRLVILAIPITVGQLVMPVVQFIDSTVVPIRLQAAGYSVADSTALFGQLAGMATTLINFPTMITVALAASLVPAISEAYAKQNYTQIQERGAVAIRLAILLCLPASAGLYILSTEIMTLLYGYPQAGPVLATLSASALFLGLHQTLSGILQGLGRTATPVKNMFIGAAFKLLISYTLTAIPLLNVRGAALGSVAGFGVAAFLNFLAVRKVVGIRLQWGSMVIKPLLAVVVMAAATRIGYNWVFGMIGSNSIGTLVGIGIGGIVYGITLLLIGGIREQDIAFLPKFGPKLVKLLKKFRVLRG